MSRYGIALRGFGKELKKYRDKITYEVPTGPHTDVRKRKLKPSYLKKITGVGVPKVVLPKTINPRPKEALPPMKKK